jgi:hypothetical protein
MLEAERIIAFVATAHQQASPEGRIQLGVIFLDAAIAQAGGHSSFHDDDFGHLDLDLFEPITAQRVVECSAVMRRDIQVKRHTIQTLPSTITRYSFKKSLNIDSAVVIRFAPHPDRACDMIGPINTPYLDVSHGAGC